MAGSVLLPWPMVTIIMVRDAPELQTHSQLSQAAVDVVEILNAFVN